MSRARNGDYLFYDANGAPLMLAPIVSGNSAGRYALWEINSNQKTTIISSLLLARSVRGIPGMETIEAIEAYITQRLNLQ